MKHHRSLTVRGTDGSPISSATGELSPAPPPAEDRPSDADQRFAGKHVPPADEQPSAPGRPTVATSHTRPVGEASPASNGRRIKNRGTTATTQRPSLLTGRSRRRVLPGAPRLQREYSPSANSPGARAGSASPVRDVQLDSAVLLAAISSRASARGRRPLAASSSRQHLAAAFVIDRPAVVGIDQAEVPELGALVDVGHAGGGDLQQRLGQRS